MEVCLPCSRLLNDNSKLKSDDTLVAVEILNLSDVWLTVLAFTNPCPPFRCPNRRPLLLGLIQNCKLDVLDCILLILLVRKQLFHISIAPDPH